MFPHRDAVLPMIRSGVAPPALFNRGSALGKGEPEFGFAFPSAEGIDLIKRRLRPGVALLELGAGAGVWSAVISKAIPTIEVIATDSMVVTWESTWYRVRPLAAAVAMARYPNADLLTVYPAPFIADVLRTMRHGQRLFWRGPTDAGMPQYFPSDFGDIVIEIDRADCEPAEGQYNGKLIVFERRLEPHRDPANDRGGPIVGDGV